MPLSPSRLWFNFIHNNFLIYNMCWEDVEVDLELLELSETSELMMITSAGCNALSYLLSNPSSITSVDINPFQTALLDLKIALIKHGDHSLFLELFTKGKSSRFEIELPSISAFLRSESKEFWDQKSYYFHPDGKGYFYEGGAGYFARFLNYIIDQKKVRPQIESIVFEEDQSARESMYIDIERRLWSGLEQSIWTNAGILGFAGIPITQRKAVGNLNEFMKKVFHTVLVKQEAKYNPYWCTYLFGEIPTSTLPNYLSEKNFHLLQKRIDSINFKTNSILDSLKTSSQSFSHFLLLDHMDWLVNEDEKTLQEEWKLILDRSQTNAKILLRTAFDDLTFIPNFVFDHVEFNHIDPDWLSQKDRVGTYSGTYLGVMK